MAWHLGARPLGDSPTIIIAVRDTVAPEEIAAALAGGAHAIEFRVDQFAQSAPEAVVSAVRARRKGPSLATIRHAREGGAWTYSEEERLALYRALLPEVDGVDCELESSEICGEVFADAKAVGKLAIGSFHDFQSCPDDARLDALVALGDSAGADIVKVAAHCASPADLRRLAAFTLRHAERGIIVIGMGPAGTPSRVFFPALGSLLTYTFLGEPAAPGQLNCDVMVAYLSALYN